MEKQIEQTIFTKASAAVKKDAQTENLECVTLSPQEAEEYRAYKRRKKVEEIMTAIARSEATLTGDEETQRVCERALRLKQAAVKVAPSRLPQIKGYLEGSKVKIDCVIGGHGETLTRVKAYEARLAMRYHAKEVSVMIAPSYLSNCRYAEIRKELKRLRRVAKKAVMKVCVAKTYTPTTLSRVARLASEVGAKYFCVPYYAGCEKLRLDLTNGCLLEVTGVETLADFRKMTEAGMGRIVTSSIWDIYSEWMQEAEKETEKISTLQCPSCVKTLPTVETLPKENALPAQESQAAKSQEPQTVPPQGTPMPPPTIGNLPKNLPISVADIPNVVACLQLPRATGIKTETSARTRAETGMQHARMEGSDLKFL